MMAEDADSTPIVLTVFFLWVLLVLILIYLYKRLNRDTNNQYTVQRFVYAEGGLRDRVMQGINFINARLRPDNGDEEEEIGDMEDGCEEGEGEDEDEREGPETNEDENDEEDKDDSSDDYSSIDLRERVQKNSSAEDIDEKKDEEQKEEAKGEVKEDAQKQEEQEVKDEEKVGLLVNIKPFSGSAVWSGEKSEESNVTAL